MQKIAAYEHKKDASADFPPKTCNYLSGFIACGKRGLMGCIRLMVVILVFAAVAGFAQFPSTYTGTAYSAAPVNGEPQKIPGRIYLSYFDNGGEGVAYHDDDPINAGAKYGNFRPTEGVDVEVMQTGNKWADSAGKAIPPGQPYVGWCLSGEWLNFTITVQTAGKYAISGIMTSGATEQIQRVLIIDNKDTIGNFKVPPTGAYHSWRVFSNLAQVSLPAGKHLLTLLDKGAGDMQCFDFTLVQASSVASAPGLKRDPAAARSVGISKDNRLHIRVKASPNNQKAGRLFDFRGRMVSSISR